jgi:lysine-N-methylase
MAPTRLQTQAVAQFTCLGAECPDTCCQGWGMQLTAETVMQYQAHAPDLLDAVSSGEAQFIMKRDPVTDSCVKFEHGWCGIQRDYGDDFLGDACHFFPRVSRAMGEVVVTGSTLSCPETARLMLYGQDGFSFTPRTAVRTPYSLRNYLPDGMSEEAALAIHQVIMDVAGDASVTAEYALMRVSAMAHALEMQPVTVWPEAAPLYASMADGRIPAAEPQVTDIFFLVEALHGLVMAGGRPRSRLLDITHTMAAMLAITHEAGGLRLADDSSERALAVIARLRAQATVLQPVLHRYLQAQLSQALFPFSGFGNTLSERIGIIGVRFATVKLALATLPEQPEQGEVIRIIQTLSRFMDHLADPTLSLQIYRETGWLREARLRALLME